MDAGLIVQGLTWALLGLMAFVVISDARRYIIPNWLNATVIGLYVLAAILLPGASWMAVAAAAIVLLIGLAVFALGLMGGGDIKLLVALTLWTGWGMPTVQFLFLTAMAGGLLVIVVLLIRAMAVVLVTPTEAKPLPRLLQRKEPVPYGIAIAIAFVWLLLRGEVAILG